MGQQQTLKKQQKEHKTNKTNKFGRAIKEYGYDAFDFEILTTITFSCRPDSCDMCELYNLEDEYITKYDSIDNGFNSRMNSKLDLYKTEYFFVFI